METATKAHLIMTSHRGVGIWTFANGNKIKGEYTQTKKVRLDNDDDNVEPEIRLNWRTIETV